MRVYVAMPVPRAKPRFKPSKMIRCEFLIGPGVVAGILNPTLSYARTISCRGYLVHRSAAHSAGRQYRAFSVKARMLHRSAIFVDSARLIVKSYQHHGKHVCTKARVGTRMRQHDLVPAIALAS